MKLYNECSYESIYNYLVQIDSLFSPPLSMRVRLEEYAKKLKKNARVYAYVVDLEIVAAIFYYVNNKEAYIPVLSCIVKHSGQGLMLKLVKKMERDLVLEGLSSIALTTWLGSRALNFYIKSGFAIENIVQDRPDSGKTVLLRKNLHPKFDSFSFIEPPLEVNSRLNDYLGVNLMIKRDDLFPVIGGGSKARKLKYILKNAVENGCTAVVTAGSNYSNHLRATAVLCCELGLKFTACIHDEMPELTDVQGNLKLTTELAHRVEFVPMSQIKHVMDSAVHAYINEGERPLYIWGGGHSIEGTVSFLHAVGGIINDLNQHPRYLFVASGTGTTQAGLIIGTHNYIPNCDVIGVSVARNQQRGRSAVADAIADVSHYLDTPMKTPPVDEINFDDSFLFGGYGKVTSELLDELDFVKKNFGLVLDPIYSGKAFFAIKRYIEEGIVEKGSDVLFWNTGGILNTLN